MDASRQEERCILNREHASHLHQCTQCGRLKAARLIICHLFTPVKGSTVAAEFLPGGLEIFLIGQSGGWVPEDDYKAPIDS